MAEKLEVVRWGAKFHDSFDACAVAPGAVKENHFALGREVFDVALKIPLPHFAFGWFLKSDDVGGLGVQVLHEPFDGATFSGGITPFKKNEDSLPGGFDPLLDLEEFGLKLKALLFVFRRRHFFAIGINSLTVGNLQGDLVAEALGMTFGGLQQFAEVGKLRSKFDLLW